MSTTTLKCKNCGAELKWSPKEQLFQCEFCDTKYTEADLADSIPKTEQQTTAEENTSSTSASEDASFNCKCDYCGAEVMAQTEDAATFCVFCQRPVTITKNISGDFKPDLVIPFKVDLAQAKKTLEEFTKKRRFLPDGFTKNLDKVRGIYIPFWIYDGGLDFNASGTATKVSTWSDSDYKYVKTDTYSVERQGHIEFKDIPVDASIKMDNAMLESVEPFNFDEIQDFSPTYLSGFLAQRYDDDKKECETRVLNRMVESKDIEVNKTLLAYTTKSIRNNNHNVTALSDRYGLLPVWLLTVSYNDKEYCFAMNGQTGKFVGNMPVDKKKALMFSLKTFLISFGASVVITMLIALLGGM